MRHIIIISLGLASVFVAGPAFSRNDVYHLPIGQAMESPLSAGRFGSFVFTFGDQKAATYRPVGDYVATERSHFHGRTEQEACQSTFLDALEDLKDHATKAGAQAVTGIISYYRNASFSSATEFECHAGSNGVFVWLKGTMAASQ